MAERRCPVCGQSLPKALTEAQIQLKVQELATSELAKERKRLQHEFNGQLASERERARREAEKAMQQELQRAQQRADRAEKERESDSRKQAEELDKRVRMESGRVRRQVQNESAAQIRAVLKKADEAEKLAVKKIKEKEKEIEEKVRQEFARTIRINAREDELKMEKLQAERQRDRVRYEAERVKLQAQLDNLVRKLEKQSSERFGEEGEMDLFVELTRAFPKDRIERIGRGKRGADIVQHVMDGNNCAGCIIYENKNVKATGWSNAFITQETKYRTQYDTPYVVIVSRAFPKKERDFCIAQGIPVVRPGMAVSLASVIREGIVAIGRLRLAGAGKDQKAHDLMQYLVSDRFETRFKGISSGIEDLREQQRKERTWHENAWERQSALHENIDKSHREINAQLQNILTTKRPLAIAARA